MPKGTKECLWCGTEIVLVCTRDLTRKKFCSRSCSSRYYSEEILPKMRSAITQDSIEKQRRSLKKYYETNSSPFKGMFHSDDTKRQISKSVRNAAQSKPVKGYRMIRVNGACKPYHRHLMELHLGRTLCRDEVVHHIDGDVTNNSLDNLEVMPLSEHTSMHKTSWWESRRKEVANVSQGNDGGEDIQAGTEEGSF